MKRKLTSLLLVLTMVLAMAPMAHASLEDSNFYATVELDEGVVDMINDAADADGSGNQVNDLMDGDTFTVSVRTNVDAMSVLVAVEFDTAYLQLIDEDGEPTTDLPEGWAAFTSADAADSTIKHYQLFDPNNFYEADDAVGAFHFKLTTPDDAEFTDGKVEVPFTIFTGEDAAYGDNNKHFQAEIAKFPYDPAETDTAAAGINTKVNLRENEKLVEVTQYGDNTALVIIYTKAEGAFVLTDPTIFAEAKTLVNVTNARYAYRNATNDDPVQAWTTFTRTGADRIKMHAIVVNANRLIAAVNAYNAAQDPALPEIVAVDDAADGADVTYAEQYLLDAEGVLTLDATAETPEAIVYGTLAEGTDTDVDASGTTNTADHQTVLQMAQGDGTLVGETATGRAAYFNTMLDAVNASTLRSDIVRGATNESNYSKQVGNQELNKFLPLFTF
jgi:hypothetical protein